MLRYTLALFSLALIFEVAPRAAANDQAKMIERVVVSWTFHNCDFRELVRLGHQDFRVRQQAFERLVDRGVEVWDLLAVASESKHHEISSASRRILETVDFQPMLNHPTRVLDDYRALNHADRARAIIQLGRSFEERDQLLLAQLIRFEQDSFLARCAAVELLTNRNELSPKCFDVVRRSHREAASWLRTELLARNDGPLAWKTVIKGILNEASRENPIRYVNLRLVKWYAKRCSELGHRDEAIQTAQAMIAVLPDDKMFYSEVMDWCLLHQFYPVGDALGIQAEKRFDSIDVSLQWRLAELAWRVGNQPKHDDVLRATLASLEKTPEAIIQHSMLLKAVGLNRMAVAILNALHENDTADPVARIHARLMLAELRFQSEGPLVARDLLAEAVSELEKVDHRTVTSGEYARLRHKYFSYLVAVQQSNWQTISSIAQEIIEKPIELLESNWVITLEDMPEQAVALLGDDSRKTLASLTDRYLRYRIGEIEELRSQFDSDEKRDRVRRVDLAQSLNSYAWTACQTGRDLMVAEDAAREANLLNPGSGEMLDTLAACLHRQGKWNEAIVIQGQATIRSPYSQTAKNRLAQYRREWAMAQMPGLIR